MIAITALAIAWHVFQCHYRPYRLVKDLQECGAEVEFDRKNLSWFTRCLGSLLPESSLWKVKSVHFTGNSSKPFDYSRLRELKSLHGLSLLGNHNDHFRSMDFAFLDHLRDLHSLEIWSASVDAALMEALVRHKSLDKVTFFACDFVHLDEPPNVENGGNTRLQTISIAICSEGTYLAEWLNQFPCLQELSLSNNLVPGDDLDFDRLAPSTKLKQFAYNRYGVITPDKKQALQEKFPNAHLDVLVYEDSSNNDLQIGSGGIFEIFKPQQ